MIRRTLADGVQLNNKAWLRTVASYAYLGLVAGLAAGMLYTTWPLTHSHPDNVVEVVYLVVVLVILSSADVRMDRGRINLSGIAIGAAAILLNPLDATIVGASVGTAMARRGRWGDSIESTGRAARSGPCPVGTLPDGSISAPPPIGGGRYYVRP